MLTLHYDLVSASAAVAVLRLQRVADAGGRVRFEGIDPLGLDVAVPATVEQLDGFQRWRERAAELGLTMRQPHRRPPTWQAHLLGGLAEQLDLGAAWRSTALTAYWTHGADLGDRGVLVDLATQAGLDPSAAAALIDDPGERSRVRQRAALAHRRGIGDVPVLEADGTYLSAHLETSALMELAQL